MVELCLRYWYYCVGSGSLPRHVPLILPGVRHRFNLSPCGHITDTNGLTLKFLFQYNAGNLLGVVAVLGVELLVFRNED